ncbi:hypothetical protein K3495_g6362 [Podosphaera aphanis]|nr:hypothetical protein K3495_g6362 [Podosphaera aphanis]
MDLSTSPQVSPMKVSRKIDRHQSYSPAPQPLIPQSKRDRKRLLIRDAYSAMEDGFSANKDNHYRLQLQTLQIDMNLIGAADPHGRGLLPNNPAEIENLVRESIHVNRMTQFGAELPAGAGRIYAEFARECNNAMEERDAALARLHRDVAVKMTEIQSTHNYYKKLASNEHKALRRTLRDRLINIVSNKKSRLAKDKETDISDSTAMLLHPSQFGIANPSSPSGVLGKRATRNRREAEEPPCFPDTTRRKRKGLDRDESPVSTIRQRVDNRSATPSWLAEKNHLVATQIESPLYSVDKLFTEKELSMTYNAAALAAHSYIVRHKDKNNPSDDISESSDSRKSTGPETTLDDDEIGFPWLPAERQLSHATRSTRGTYTSGLGIDAFDDVTLPANFQALTRQIPKLPPMISQLGSRNFVAKNDAAPPAAGLSSEEISNEVELINRARQLNDEKGLGRNLETDKHALRLLSEVAFPKDGRGRERWVASENRENLPQFQKSGRGRDRDIIPSSEAMSKQNSRA